MNYGIMKNRFMKEILLSCYLVYNNSDQIVHLAYLFEAIKF